MFTVNFPCQEADPRVLLLQVALSGAHTIGLARSVQPTGPMDATPNTFDNRYYQSVGTNGSFPSDRALMGPVLQPITLSYAANQTLFFEDFKAAFVHMGLQGTGMPMP